MPGVSRKSSRRLAFMVGLACATLPASAAERQPSCDRACLLSVNAKLADALVSGDWSTLATTPDLRITDNGRDVRAREGVTNNIAAFTWRQRYADPVSGRTAMFAVARTRDDKQLIISVLATLPGKAVSGVELIYANSNQGFFKPADFPTPMAGFDKVLPAASRSPREEMIRIVESYWTGLISQDASVVLAAPTCRRFENGVQTTGDDGCAGTPRHFPWIRAARDRRNVLIDEERGLVLTQVILDTPPTGGQTSVSPATKEQPRWPKSVLISELFKLADGKLQDIGVVLDPEPYGKRSGWTSAVEPLHPSPFCTATPTQLAANKKLLIDFYSTSGAAKAAMIADDYVQHDPAFLKREEASGMSSRDGIVAAIMDNSQPAPSGGRQPDGRELVIVMAECDLVTGVVKRIKPDPQTPGRTFELFTFDTFRVRDGKFTEHWDGVSLYDSPQAPR